MGKSLVIVESPAKAKTLEKFLGKDFKVLASYGHVRDLPRKGLGVDREHHYRPTYEVLKGKEKTLGDLKKAARAADTVYLAADPDREGEAISWHLLQALSTGKDAAKFRRARFNEITKKAVRAAIENSGEIDENRVGAQQARRIIDRLVGYEVSDLLWKKIWRGLSAGRVQTVALRIICEREKEIEAFVPVEYWTVDARLAGAEPPDFAARLLSFDGEKLKFDGSDPRVADEKRALEIRDAVQAAAWKVADVEKSERRKSPPPPFVTSQLQQVASRRLGFAVRRTMQIAQRLYEGREIGDRGTIGLITYMRTDSTRVSDEALEGVRDLIRRTYGPDSVPDKPRYFKSRAGAQEAHEAIRPTMLDLPPEAAAPYLAPDELKLYRVIWQRFVASQMSPSVTETVTAEIDAGRAVYRATGSTLTFAGYLAAYGTQADGDEEGNGESGSRLPPLAAGDALRLLALSPEAHATQPPPRFNEASLVKFLEENGIGRPSTYAEILRKIEDREYVRRKDKRFYPTALGRVVIEMLIPYFDDFFETGYTARLEEELDEVEAGKVAWTKALADFDKKFVKDRDRALEKMASSKAGIPLKDARKSFGFALVPEISDRCPKDQKPLKLRMGKNGLFIACSGYPDCDFTYHVPETEEDAPDLTEYESRTCEECGSPMKLRHSGDRVFLGCTAYPKCRNTVPVPVQGGRAEPQPTGEKCPECGGDLVKKRGRFGEFVACGNYPKCKYRPPKPVVDTGVACPKDGGKIVERRGRFGFFYACANYPKCDFSFRYRPHPEPCPKCGKPYLLEKTLKREGTFLFCDNPECDFKKTIRPSSAAASK